MAKGWTSYENQGMLTESWRSFLSEEEQVVAGINSTEYPDSLVNILAPLIKSGAITQLQYEALERLLLDATAEDGVILEGPNGGPREFSSNTTSALSQIVDDFNLEPTALKTLQRTLDKWARMNTVKFATAARSEDLPPPEEEPTPVEVEEEPEETEPEEEPTPVEVEEEPPEGDIPGLFDSPAQEEPAEDDAEEETETATYSLSDTSEMKPDQQRALTRLKEFWTKQLGDQFDNPGQQFKKDLDEFISFLGPYKHAQVAESNRLARTIKNFATQAGYAPSGFDAQRLQGALRKLPDNHGAKRFMKVLAKYPKHIPFIVDNILPLIQKKEAVALVKKKKSEPISSPFPSLSPEELPMAAESLLRESIVNRWQMIAGIKKRVL